MHDTISNKINILKPIAVGDGNAEEEKFTVTGKQKYFQYHVANKPDKLMALKGLNRLIIFPELSTIRAHQFILKQNIVNMLSSYQIDVSSGDNKKISYVSLQDDKIIQVR